MLITVFQNSQKASRAEQNVLAGDMRPACLRPQNSF